ncbi:MAG: thermostable hemolysin, partial [Rudaea sp.]
AFELFEHTGSDRAIAEEFISRRFAQSFGARVEAFMPRLFTVRNQDGFICGAFGLRSATHKLFVEHYINRPMEEVIAMRTGETILRHRLVEVGHLSGAFPSAMRATIRLLTECVHREGAAWIAFTGTSSVRNCFRRMGLSPIAIQVAAIENIPTDARAVWGNYHDHSPWVFVGSVEEGYRALIRDASRTARKIERIA